MDTGSPGMHGQKASMTRMLARHKYPLPRSLTWRFPRHYIAAKARLAYQVPRHGSAGDENNLSPGPRCETSR